MLDRPGLVRPGVAGLFVADGPGRQIFDVGREAPSRWRRP